MSKKNIDSDMPSDQRIKRASMALEELLWSLKGTRLELLQDASRTLTALAHQSDNSTIVGNYKSADPNKHFLIGVLPRLFQDRTIFAQNEDIVDFAATALGLNMSRSEKRSRYEIIGKVICETDALDEKELTNLVRALEVLLNSKDQLEIMAEKKKLGSFSWNETIQDLLGSR